MALHVVIRVPSLVPHVSLVGLEALAWGELGAARARRISAHVGACPACRTRLEWVRRLPSALARVPMGSIPRDATAVLERRARGERVILPAQSTAGWI